VRFHEKRRDHSLGMMHKIVYEILGIALDSYQKDTCQKSSRNNDADCECQVRSDGPERGLTFFDKLVCVDQSVTVGTVG